MTDGLRKSHLRKAPQVGLSEVGLPEGNPLSKRITRARSRARLNRVLPFQSQNRDFVGNKVNFAPGEWCEESGTRRGKNSVAQRWGCCTRPWFLC